MGPKIIALKTKLFQSVFKIFIQFITKLLSALFYDLPIDLYGMKLKIIAISQNYLQSNKTRICLQLHLTSIRRYMQY